MITRKGAATFDGLRVAWTTTEVGVDPAHRLFASFPAPEGSGTADIEVSIGPRSKAVGLEGFRPTFHHFELRGFEREGVHLLIAPAVDVCVSHDGRSIDLRLDAAVTHDERTLANVPLFIALTIALRAHGRFHLHAGAVVRADGTRIVVAGDSGVGKSTLTLGLLDDGAASLGDDAIFASRRDGGPALVGFPRPFHLTRQSLEAHSVEVGGTPGSDGKFEYGLDLFGTRRCERMQAPDVLLFPEIVAAPRTAVEPLDAASAFGHLLRAGALGVVDGMPRVAEQMALWKAIVLGARSYRVLAASDLLRAGRHAWELIGTTIGEHAGWERRVDG